MMPKRATLSTKMKTIMPGKKKHITSKLSGWSDDMLTAMLDLRACPAGAEFRHCDTDNEL